MTRRMLIQRGADLLFSRLVLGCLALLALAGLGIGIGAGLPVNKVETPQSVKMGDASLPDDSFLDLSGLAENTHRARVSARLTRGSTLQNALTRAGADRQDAQDAVHALFTTGLLDPRRLQIGLTVDTLLGAHTASGKRIDALNLTVAPGQQVMVRRTGNRFLSAALNAKLTPVYKRVAAPVETSIYETALSHGAGDYQIADFANAFAYDVNFQREIHPGDSFEMIFRSWQDERGTEMKASELIYAALQGQKTSKVYYRHTPSDDSITGWYDPAGESAQRFLMKTPINGARLSSGFGRRRHPISRYTRLHKGTDFAAPTGTPIYAAGNGVIERANRYGGYGKYVRIRHANGYKTAYAHLSRFGRTAKKGNRVRQGEIIGYVGSTGRSTGPHLHYEVIINGRHVNPMALDLPTGRRLTDADGMLAEFREKQNEIDEIRSGLSAETGTTTTGSSSSLNLREFLQ